MSPCSGSKRSSRKLGDSFNRLEKLARRPLSNAKLRHLGVAKTFTIIVIDIHFLSLSKERRRASSAVRITAMESAYLVFFAVGGTDKLPECSTSEGYILPLAADVEHGNARAIGL